MDNHETGETHEISACTPEERAIWGKEVEPLFDSAFEPECGEVGKRPLSDERLSGYGPEVIARIGHQRWGVENHAFNELTQYYHLTHCPHHEPVAIIAWLLFLILGFTMFELFVRLNSKVWRQGHTTLKELWRQLDHAMERVWELEPLWSG